MSTNFEDLIHSSGNTASRPAAAVPGRLYYNTQVGLLQRDNGSSWDTYQGGSALTTKGDIQTYDTVTTRLPVGTNGYVLTADSGEATGIKWAAATGGGATVVESMTTNATSDAAGGTGTTDKNFLLSAALLGPTFSANSFAAGQVWRFTVAGTFDPAANETIRFRLWFGNQSVMLLDSDAVSSSNYVTGGSATGLFFQIRGTFRVITTGGTGTIRTNGVMEAQTTATLEAHADSKLATVDTTASQQLTATIRFGSSNAGNTSRVHQFYVEQIHA